MIKATSTLALHGGVPVRTTPLPYGRQQVDAEDVAAVAAALRSDWLTTGPLVDEFERRIAAICGARVSVAVSSGTAALHAAMYALAVGPGDEVIVPAITFAATANAVLYQGGTPVFADVDPATLLIDPDSVHGRLSTRTKAVVAVDYAGQPCDYDALAAVVPAGVSLAADACHALGAAYKGRSAGTLARLSTFSFHPVKHIATGEGGMITTDEDDLAARMRLFRNHGITTDHRQRAERGAFAYDLTDLGYNYRLSDIQCALGISQAKHLEAWLQTRRELARTYDRALQDVAAVSPVALAPGRTHAYHLYVVQLELEQLRAGRDEVFAAMRAEGIGVNVHYRPVYLHPYYRARGFEPGLCREAERAYERILTLPLFASMTSADVDDTVTALRKVLGYYHR